MLKDAKKVKDELVQWIRDYFAENGTNSDAVIGISGGKDSTVVAALCVEALGADRVVGVLMPQGIQVDIDDSYRVVDALGIRHFLINIGPTVEALELTMGLQGYIPSEQAMVNMPPRIRMATLYAVAQSLPNGGRVANTCNYSEDYIGYSTKYGDSAGDFAPIAEMVVSEVKQIGYELGLPADLVDKVPADGLCGKTDEDNFGFTYEQLEEYINNGTCEDEDIDDRIFALHKHNMHKLLPMPKYSVRGDELM